MRSAKLFVAPAASSAALSSASRSSLLIFSSVTSPPPPQQPPREPPELVSGWLREGYKNTVSSPGRSGRSKDLPPPSKKFRSSSANRSPFEPHLWLPLGGVGGPEVEAGQAGHGGLKEREIRRVGREKLSAVSGIGSVPCKSRARSDCLRGLSTSKCDNPETTQSKSPSTKHSMLKKKKKMRPTVVLKIQPNGEISHNNQSTDLPINRPSQSNGPLYCLALPATESEEPPPE